MPALSPVGKALLIVEAVSLVIGPWVAEHLQSRREEEDEETDSDLDPADVLMDYLTGKIGLAPLQLLTNKQLKQAADNLITEDFQELGVKDRGAQIREIVDDIIQAASSSRGSGKAVSQEDRVGLGRLGPLRFRNSRQPLRRAAASRTQQVSEAAPDEAAADVKGPGGVPKEHGNSASAGPADDQQ
eukprot:gene11650-11795_t